MNRTIRTILFAACLGKVALLWASDTWAQVPSRNAEEFFNRMGDFSTQAERFVPGFMRGTTPEQLRQLETVEIDLRQERQLGRSVLDNYEKQVRQAGSAVLRRGKDVEYLARLVKVIQPSMVHARRYASIRVAVVDTEQPDAYSIPGGDLLFTSGLVETAESEAALVGVIAHELSHLDRQHQLYSLKMEKLAGNTPSPQNMMNAVAAMAQPFHAEFESQADEDAFQWMFAAGYDPLELARLLSRWDEQQNRQQPWMNALPSFVRSHPDAGKRAARIIELDSQRPKQSKPLYIGRDNLARRITRQQQDFGT